MAPFYVWKVKIFWWVYYSTASTIRVGTVCKKLLKDATKPPKMADLESPCEARHVVGKLQIMTTLKCRICAKSTYSTIQPVVNLFYYSTILLIFETLHKYKLLLRGCWSNLRSLDRKGESIPNDHIWSQRGGGSQPNDHTWSQR